jgi:predicted nucleic acid-binding protein
MNDRVFLDTNILVYAYDSHNPTKQTIAQELLIKGLESESAVLSVQVLGEFFSVVTRQIKPPMSPEDAKMAIELFGNMITQEIDLAMVQRAIDTLQTYRISYWDALIVAAAERAHCKNILSEDLNDSQRYNGISVLNPFK